MQELSCFSSHVGFLIYVIIDQEGVVPQEKNEENNTILAGPDQ